MSLGQEIKMQEPEISTMKIQAKYRAKKVVRAYYDDPLHYCLYTGLYGVIVALIVGIHLSWTIYPIIGILGIIEFTRAMFDQKIPLHLLWEKKLKKMLSK